MELLELVKLFIPEICFLLACLLFIAAIITASVIGHNSCAAFFEWFAVIYITGVSILILRFEFVIAMLLAKFLFHYEAIYVVSLIFALQTVMPTKTEPIVSCFRAVPAILLITIGSIGLKSETK